MNEEHIIGARKRRLAALNAPIEITRAQLKTALLNMGRLAQFKTVVAAATEATRIAIDDAYLIRRDSPQIAAIAGVLGLTDAQVDNLFARANEIDV